MSTTIQIKRSSTASAVPLSGDLAVGELAVNLADKRLFAKQADGTIIELSTNPTDLDAATLRIDGVEITASATELNSLDGLTATTAELNILDGVTATATEINKLDGFTGSTAELNILDGVTATTAELNFVDGVTSNIQTQLNSKASATASPTIALAGDATGAVTLTNLGNAMLTVAIEDDSHNHIISNVDGLQTALDGKATSAQGALADTAVQPNDNVTFGTGDFTGSVDVTGTVTADGLTVDGTDVRFKRSDTQYFRFYQTSGGQELTTTSGTNKTFTVGTADSNPFRLKTNDSKRLEINSNGDVSFYEDTGTTAKMVWDASAETLSTENFEVKSATPFLTFNDTSASNLKCTIDGQSRKLVYTADSDNYGNGSHTFKNYDQTVMVIDGSGNVGIGTPSPSGLVHSYNTTVADNILSTNTSALRFVSAGGNNYIQSGTSLSGNNAPLIFTGTNGVNERARIDSSGNLLVGTTDSIAGVLGSTVQGISLSNEYNAIYVSRSGHTTGILNRQTTDGDILTFAKDGTTVGSIGTNGGDLYIGTGDTGLRFLDASDFIYPVSASTGISRDAVIDLGYSTGRFKDLYLSGGVYLGGTGSANKLDDYEEGVWTPQFRVGGSETGVTYSSRAGYYTKIGDMVTASFEIRLTSKGSNTGVIGIYALPFITSLGAVDWVGNSASNYANFASLNSKPSLYVTTGQYHCSVTQLNTSGTGDLNMTNANCANNVIFGATITYKTSA